MTTSIYPGALRGAPHLVLWALCVAVAAAVLALVVIGLVGGSSPRVLSIGQNVPRSSPDTYQFCATLRGTSLASIVAGEVSTLPAAPTLDVLTAWAPPSVRGPMVRVDRAFLAGNPGAARAAVAQVTQALPTVCRGEL